MIKANKKKPTPNAVFDVLFQKSVTAITNTESKKKKINTWGKQEGSMGKSVPTLNTRQLAEHEKLQRKGQKNPG